MIDFYRCTGCGEPLSPWQPAICSRCIDAEADRLRKEWAEDHG